MLEVIIRINEVGDSITTEVLADPKPGTSRERLAGLRLLGIITEALEKDDTTIEVEPQDGDAATDLVNRRPQARVVVDIHDVGQGAIMTAVFVKRVKNPTVDSVKTALEVKNAFISYLAHRVQAAGNGGLIKTDDHSFPAAALSHIIKATQEQIRRRREI